MLRAEFDRLAVICNRLVDLSLRATNKPPTVVAIRISRCDLDRRCKVRDRSIMIALRLKGYSV
jgi:hypothetical protein